MHTFIPYLLLLTFYTGSFTDLNTNRIDAINSSAYDGVAVQTQRTNDHDQVDFEDFAGSVNLIKSKCTKHIWPWVFLSRIGASRQAQRAESAEGHNKGVVETVKVIDAYNESGDLEAFYRVWSVSLRLAKELGSPGIVFDPEVYGIPRGYELDYSASQLLRSPDDFRVRLEEIGRKLTDIADETYPDAVVWCLFSFLYGGPQWRSQNGEIIYPTVGYIVLGMLKQARQTKSRISVVSGGEARLGYCSKSLEDLSRKIQSRNISFAPLMQSYPHLKLGGTIAPWQRVESKTAWQRKGECGRSQLETITDFSPLVSLLLNSYDYVWIYLAKSPQFNPFDHNVAAVYNKMLGRALEESRRKLTSPLSH